MCCIKSYSSVAKIKIATLVVRQKSNNTYCHFHYRHICTVTNLNNKCMSVFQKVALLFDGAVSAANFTEREVGYCSVIKNDECEGAFVETVTVRFMLLP